MTGSNVWDGLIEAVPYMVAQIALVYLFLRAIDRWNEEWRRFIAQRDIDFQAFMSRERAARETEQRSIIAALEKISGDVERVASNLIQFETYVKTSIESMVRKNKQR